MEPHLTYCLRLVYELVVKAAASTCATRIGYDYESHTRAWPILRFTTKAYTKTHCHLGTFN